MKLRRGHSRSNLISLVPMVDVMIIMLIFFMVTSSYRELSMVPVLDDAKVLPPVTASAGESGRGTTLLIRLGGDGRPYLRGQPLDAAALDEAIRAHLAERAAGQVIVLPSGQAAMQALVDVMGVATRAGATALRVVRIDVQP